MKRRRQRKIYFRGIRHNSGIRGGVPGVKRECGTNRQGHEIGELPAVQDKDRKESCRKDFRKFCESYFAEAFPLRWSTSHLAVMEKIEAAVLHGGLFALAMPRGSGKTTISECAALWALLYGHRKFIVIIGATESAAREFLESLKTVIQEDEGPVYEDFPEVCYPVAALRGAAGRCAMQTYQGRRTRMVWGAKEVNLPVIEGSPASGSVVRITGIMGRIRGMKHRSPDRRILRPGLVIIDDPQTAQSAHSPEQCRKRVRVLSGDILGLAGPCQKISGIMPCTVIRPGDMADEILDREKHPDWNGLKTRMVNRFPANTGLWKEYGLIRKESLKRTGTIREATEFYIRHRKEMDEGAEVSWEARYNHDEVSAVQHAMNLKFQDEFAFLCEYQNEPRQELGGEDPTLSAEEIAARINGIERGIVPLNCSKLTAFVDVQKTLLYYAVVAWDMKFTGAVIDYGAWPEQRDRMFTLNTAHPVIQDRFPNAGPEGCLFQALSALLSELLSREWHVEGNGRSGEQNGNDCRSGNTSEPASVLTIERALADANWGFSTEIVYNYCRNGGWSNVLVPSHGRYVGAATEPMTTGKPKPGDERGLNWVKPAYTGRWGIRHVIYDTNFWKSFVHSRLSTAKGDPGALTLYGNNPDEHFRFAEQLTSEYRVRTMGWKRMVDEWRIKPGKKDNHWLDCLVGCAVAASMQGVRLPENNTPIAAGKAIVLSKLRS